MSEESRKKSRSMEATGGLMGIGATLITLSTLTFLSGGCERIDDTISEEIHKEAAKEMRRIERDVAADAVKQYEIAKRSGSAMDAYVHAGFVAAV